MTLEQYEKLLGIDRSKFDCWFDKHPDIDGCCCECAYRLKEDTEYICSVPLAMGENFAYRNWTEHGMCELYTNLKTS